MGHIQKQKANMNTPRVRTHRRGGLKWYVKKTGESKMARRVKRAHRDCHHIKMVEFMAATTKAKTKAKADAKKKTQEQKQP